MSKGQLNMDFSKLSTPKASQRPIDPIKIFEQLPSLPGTPNDLWRGQAEALAQWHIDRKKHDVLVALNTGAGKTLVGILMAQSLINEGVENVIYTCATVDLVEQTSREAKRIGLDHTTRTRLSFDNDLFETGKSFCITTYAALFNGHSSLRRRYFPGAVIFDDAHVAETMLRDTLTLRISSDTHPSLFTDISELFRSHFKELRIEGRFNDSLTREHPTIVMAAPGGFWERRERLIALLETHKIRDDKNLTYAYAHLRDRIDCCAATFSGGSVEFAPPFLPSLALDIFERKIRRIYLSATLKSKTDLVRAFGRLPEVRIEPDNDAGNGERMILFGRTIPQGISTELVSTISATRKVLLAVPSYRSAKIWAQIGIPPQIEEFSKELNKFREAKRGSFVLVSRVDGIDLPHETCRIMILDELPAGSSLMERFQWEFLRMGNTHSTKIANRLVQLFGRINRGRNDYGVFLVSGQELNAWLNKDRNVALLPQLLQRQITLGRIVQDGMNIKTPDAVVRAIDSVLAREPTWIQYYGENINRDELDQEQVARAAEAEEQMVAAAVAEAGYAAAMWRGHIAEARQILDEANEATARVDALLAGWHSVWHGAALEYEGDAASASLAYQRALRRLGSGIALPRIDEKPSANEIETSASPFTRNVDAIVSLTSNDAYKREVDRIRKNLRSLDGATSRQMEEAVRFLGECIGFQCVRPDNDVGTGPDVLWIDDESKSCIGFELKTEKKSSAIYWKKDIAQGHDHLEYIDKANSEYSCYGLLFVGPDGSLEARANPTDKMWLCLPSTLVNLREELLALISDLRGALPLERPKKTREACGADEWNITALFSRLCGKPMHDLKRMRGDYALDKASAAY